MRQDREQRASFDEFVAGFGFDQFPFTQFSTENELHLRAQLFCQPSEYSPTLEAFSNGQTMFVVGNRGTGKTALLYDLEARAQEDSNLLLARLDDYSQLATEFTVANFYRLLITKLTRALFLRIVNERSRVKRLKPEQRMLLVYLLREFFPAVSKAELVRRIEEVSRGKVIAFAKRVYNFFRDLLNYGLSTALQLTSDVVRQHFSMLPPQPSEVLLKSYFPEIPYEADKRLEKQLVSYEFLDRCLELVRDLGYSRFILVIDKLDEDTRLRNDAELIANFIEPILTDNKLLLNSKIQEVVSVWSVPFSLLADRVRSQKIYCARLTWKTKDLETALNRRLSVFSRGRVTDYRVILDEVVTSDQITEIFYLANGNPRDLWHIFNKMFHAQYEIDPLSRRINSEAIRAGLTAFVQGFNYYEYYPRAIGARADSLDVYSFIRHLLRLGQIEFTRNAFKEATGVSGGSVSNYLRQMQRMGLITDFDRDGTHRVYRITDPKVEYAITHGVNIAKLS